MEQNEIRRFQNAQLALLHEADRICRELDLCYYMIGGTLLGAVRHGGVIPWDADIDIAMPRADYEKFRRYWEENSSERFFYQCYDTEKNHLSPHALLRIKGTHVIMQSMCAEKLPVSVDGIYMDIFPLDEAPVSEAEQKRQMKEVKRIRRIVELKAAYTYGTHTSKVKKLAKRIVQICLSPWKLQNLNRKLDQVMQRHTECNSGYLVSMASRYSYWKQLLPKEIYGNPQRIPFEDGMFCAPANPDALLKSVYGDYMTLPPMEERGSFLDKIAYIDYGTNLTDND